MTKPKEALVTLWERGCWRVMWWTSRRLRHWKPEIKRYWKGQLVHYSWLGLELVHDRRTDVLGDLMGKDRHAG